MHAPATVPGGYEVDRIDEREAIRNPVRGWAVFVAALVLFSPALFAFSARVIDLGAMRVAHGAVPYRDFWTMYAPGSIYINAAAFRIFGTHLLVTNALGVIAAAAAVAVYYRVAGRLLSPLAAALATVVYAFAFFHAPYHGGLTSYPAAILFIWLALDRAAAHARTGSGRDLMLAGLCLGAAVLCKHDLGGYASIATALAVLFTSSRARVRNVAVLAGSATAVVIVPLIALIAAGAGPDMLRNLVTWPLGDFKVVRPEFFPLLPPLWQGGITASVLRNAQWGVLQIPLIIMVVAVPLIWSVRHRITSEQKRILVFALVLFPLSWTAAHVQVNTHAVTLPAVGAMFGFAGLLGMREIAPVLRRDWRFLLVAATICWVLSMLPERVISYHGAYFPNPQLVRLPRLEGIVTASPKAQNLRGLARAIEQAAPAEAPVVMLAGRNDIVIHGEGTPYWLTDRRIVTRHHELHPGITDTEEYQRQMLADLQQGMPPVVVREHRFGRRALQPWIARFQQQGVQVGAMLIDDWLAKEYAEGSRYGMYEVMIKR